MLSLTDKLDILICMRLDTPDPKTVSARKDITAAILKDTPELAQAMERFEQALKTWDI